MAKKIVIANWKMNPTSAKETRKIFTEVKKESRAFGGVEVVVCPPFPYLSELSRLYSGKVIKFGVQDVFWKKKGPFTGEVSPDMVSDLGGKYVIIGHSERRSMGETDEVISKKAQFSAKANLNVILCVGESVRDKDGDYLKFLEDQIIASLRGFSRRKLGNLIIAYEPLWAIGKDTKDAIRGRDLHEMSIFIVKVLKSIFKTDQAKRAPVIYGGSVTPQNAGELMKEGRVNGFLVGHESLKPKRFVEIIKETKNA